MDSVTYKKRAGTSGIQGQLYETKLISLIYFRMIHDDTIDQFSLATNKDDVGAFDDICFKAQIKGFERPISVFIQAKHRENDKFLTFTNEIDLAKYFDSYLKIRRTFEPSSKNRIFGGKYEVYEETECFFVMYTPAKGDPNNKKYEGRFAPFFNELLRTGDCCTQTSYTDESLVFLCNIVMKEQITTLAEQFAKFICNESNSVMSMNNDLILRYHVILANNVLHVSEIQPEGYRTASFRQDFFTSNEEFLMLFKNVLCLQVLKNRRSEETNLQSLLLQFLNEPSDVTALSRLLGSILIYKNRKLEFVSKSMRDDLKRQLDKINVSQSMEQHVYEAAEIAAKEYLLSLILKVSAVFGNKDLTIRGNSEKVEKRLNYLTSKIIEILEKCNDNNIVALDESLGDGFLQLNGGISSAIGNILVFDEGSKLLKFTDNCESLGNLARRWYASLKSKIENLHEYKFDVKVRNFPKLSFEREEYDVSLVRDFYDKLLFYTNQADQSKVEDILREEIKNHPCSDANSRDRSDVIFLKYHDDMLKLWMMPKTGLFLTKQSKIYQDAVADAMREPLVGVLNIMQMIKNKNYTFSENVMKQFELHGQIIGSIIATESCELTVAKVEQYLEKRNRFILDLENIFKLPFNNFSTLCKELTVTTKEEILIIVCNFFQVSRKSRGRLADIAKAVSGKQILIITNKTSVDIITEHFSQVANVINDETTAFSDLSVESQKKFLATSKIKIQGKEVILADIIEDDEADDLIDNYVFNKIINNETVEVGDAATYNNYIKQLYIDRRVSRPKNLKLGVRYDVKDKTLNTFYDLEENLVLITGEIGMGKSTLLSHLTYKTKEFYPKVWIVRINLAEHEVIVKLLNENPNNISEFFKFFCQAALGEEYDKRQKEPWRKEEGELTIEVKDYMNRTVFPMKCLGGKSKIFQLKMFLHYYHTGNLIFLFDGLDEINISSKWQLKTAVLSLQKLVRNLYPRHKVWITSRSLNIIEQELGPSYKLENFSPLEQDAHLNSLWKFKIQLKNVYLKKILEHDCFVNDIHFFLLPNLDSTGYLRGYALFLEFLKMQSTSAGIDFPYDKFYNKFMKDFGFCDSTIPCFPEDTVPWDLSALAVRFQDELEDMRERYFPMWQWKPKI